MERREVMRILAAVPLAAGFSWTPAQAAEAARKVRAIDRTSGYAPTFFTAHEYDTVRILSDLVIPKDERSGSATEAGVPEFIDYLVGDNENLQTPIRGGLSWLDRESTSRFGKAYLECVDTDRRALLDDIAWPAKARPEMSQGVAFFTRFRDLTASGFFSSQMGVGDLQYLGNTVVPEWTGCPDEQLRKLGVRYDD